MVTGVSKKKRAVRNQQFLSSVYCFRSELELGRSPWKFCVPHHKSAECLKSQPTQGNTNTEMAPGSRAWTWTLERLSAWIRSPCAVSPARRSVGQASSLFPMCRAAKEAICKKNNNTALRTISQDVMKRNKLTSRHCSIAEHEVSVCIPAASAEGDAALTYESRPLLCLY